MNSIKTVSVNASGQYDILIGSDLLSRVGELTASVKKPCRTVVVTDSNVDALYGEKVVCSLEKAGFETHKFVFEAGEKSKNADVFVQILEFLAQKRITRTDLVVALGGGVVGDITGFAASCYLRGIDFVQIPTTLLSAVDSSVGGKTAIDLKAGKNLAGAFYQPIAVVCDTDTFDTLPEREKACGYAEVVKYGVLFDEKLFESLEKHELSMQEIVEKCVIFKRDIVERDEFDKGERMLLNLGHTAAHGIEKHSGYSLSHGQAVAVGMVIASKIAENEGVCEKGLCARLCNVLETYNLPICYDISAKELCDAALSDKKRDGAKITLVLPERIGKCVLDKRDTSQLEQLFSTAL